MPDRRTHPFTLAGLIVTALMLCGAGPSPTGLQRDVVFSQAAPLASSAELVRRLLSPLAAERVRAAIAASGKVLNEQSIALPEESFILYVPPAPPPRGYGLLVFVPPWEEARLPPDWPPVLDRLGVIAVSAARSGNRADIFGRRAPLAVIAAQNVMARYPVDPDRVYIAGFSGGSRVAMRLVLGYPDLFRGAILNAGSDPVGEGEAPLPPRELLDQFVPHGLLAFDAEGLLECGDVKPAFLLSSLADDACAIRDQSVHQGYIGAVCNCFDVVGERHIARHEDVSFNACCSRVRCERSSGISGRGNGKLTQSVLPRHAHRQRHASRFEGAGGICAFFLYEHSGIALAVQHRRPSFAQRNRLNLGKHGAITPHSGPRGCGCILGDGLTR